MTSSEDILAILPERLGAGTRIGVTLLPTDVDLYHEIARTMFELIEARNLKGLPACFIVPVGPVGQYERLARLVNERGLSLRRVTLIQMDEYMTSPTALIDADHPLSFRRHLREHFFDRLHPDLAPPSENWIVPSPQDIGNVARAIERAGGVQMCIGGIGITGHVAFNDPPALEEPSERFAKLGTRVVRLSLETRVINAVTAASGNIDAIPPWAVTVGMKEILEAERIRIYMNRPWQRAIVRRWVHGPITSQVPASLLQTHGDVHLTITEEAARTPTGRLR